MQHQCANVIVAEPGYNWATEHQGTSRVYRIGQELEVEIIRLFTEGTYQELHEYFMPRKAKAMFAAFKELQVAGQEAAEVTSSSQDEGEVAMAVFGIFRRRVLDAKMVESSKVQAKGKGTGKAAA
ncbi:hypothetical protein HBI56_142340 [Parastagonospora nodorum]|uniref:Uncharacterized protein n=1 Tax=Phaeosphaeria nodorum (strain SN15 / ATCC MYA-4574 / FGSC 10173) TaxID=321614 RepID=A0A7U2F9I5_PHANO|nr:hypothetical protein HBH56_034730 [Parastagonospora nodorum]QRD00144.1 hypothetical protein JI435_070450 [Parastagonospora nodorum SN15]KAH3933999.1 hypothetical protein HBH54_064720 [Parastagonospora nodorum]KAH3980380.1 hypothetical protein HBH52_092540 [Parastagonospora nodorum]KAH4002023.1 hypothetical protein HBI10_081690 [Parastagonospora nodorum]